MKKNRSMLQQFPLILLCLFVWCFCSYVQADNSDSNLTVGSKSWQVGFHDENDKSKIIELITNGETIDKWTELLTFQSFKFTFRKEVTPTFFADTEVANLRAKGLKYEYVVLKTTPEEAIIEFKVNTPVAQQQDEIQRIVKTADNHFVILHYAIKKSDMGVEQRTLWTDALQGIDVNNL